MSEEMADVRAIALIRLAREFQHAYEHWLWAWAKLKSYQKVKRLLEGLENHCQSRGGKLSEDVEKEVKGEIASWNFRINGEAWELCRYYANLRRLEREIAKVLDEPWEWRDGSEEDAVWESKKCSEQE